MHQQAFLHRMIHAVQHHLTLSLQHIVQLSASLVTVQSGPIDIHGVRPCRHSSAFVLPADQAVPPPAGTPLARRIPFMPNQQWPHSRAAVILLHLTSLFEPTSCVVLTQHRDRARAVSLENQPRRSPLYGRAGVGWMWSTRRVAAFVNYLRRMTVT
jgi:hypothetical protein